MGNIKLPMPKLSLPKFKMPAFSFKGIKLPETFSFMPSLQKSVLAIEMGDQWLKLAAAVEKNKGEKQLVWTACEPSQGVDEFSLAMKIAQLVKNRHLKPSRIVVSFPTQHLTTRILSLPSTDETEIHDIVELQAVKQTPYSREEITSGFHKIESDETGYSKIFLAISHRDQPSHYFRTAEMAFLLPDQITPSVEGLRFWLRLIREKEMRENKEPVLILEIDDTSTDLLVMAGSSMIYARSIGVGAKQVHDQGPVMESELLREVQRSLESGDGMADKKISHVILTGVPEGCKTIAALLSRELNVPCEVIPSLEALGTHASSEAVQSAAQSPVSFSALAGLLLSSETSSINLMPPDVRLRKGLENRARELAFMGTLLLTLVMLGSLTGFEKIYKRSVYLDYLKKEYSSIKQEAESVERMVDKMRLADEQSGGQGSFLEVLNDTTTVISDGLMVNSMEYNAKEKNVLIRGVSQEMSAVFQFLSTLEGTPSLEQVKTRNVAKRKAGDKEISEFEILANLPGASKEKK